ncbi:hypothetical protein HID58_046754, partial [Brassica napus]
ITHPHPTPNHRLHLIVILFLSPNSSRIEILFLSPNSSRITPPMSVLELQCYLINPPFKIPTDLPHPPSGSMISRSLFIPLSLLPQITKSMPLSWRKRLQSAPAKLLLLSSSDMRIHFWEARKNVKGGPDILLGIEMLMIDAEICLQGTLAQGFIGQNRRNQYEEDLQCGSIYTLTNFYASNSKVMYHVADQRLVICISHASALSKVEEDIEGILTERFRVHSFSDFEANCDLRGDLHGKV